MTSVPWGDRLNHSLGPLDILGFPLAFTQNRLLTADDFVKEAVRRGVQVHREQLVELHRQRALVPFFRILGRPRRAPVTVSVDREAIDGYGVYRSPLAWPELDRGLKEPAALADRLERAVGSGGSRASPVAEHAPVLVLDLAEVGGDVVPVEGVDLGLRRCVLVGHRPVGDAGVDHRHVQASVPQHGGDGLEDPSVNHLRQFQT